MGRLRETKRGPMRRGLVGLIILAVATALLGIFARLAFAGGWFAGLDAWTPAPPSEGVRSFAQGLSSVASALVAAIASALFALFLLVRRRGTEGLVLLGSGLTAVIAQNLLREWVNRMPPGEALNQTGAFPSSHVFFSVAVYGLFAYFLVRLLRTTGRRVAAGVVGVMVIALVAWSRLILGTQHVTDVLGGLLLGLVWLVVGAWVASGHQAERRGLSFRR